MTRIYQIDGCYVNTDFDKIEDFLRSSKYVDVKAEYVDTYVSYIRSLLLIARDAQSVYNHIEVEDGSDTAFMDNLGISLREADTK